MYNILLNNQYRLYFEWSDSDPADVKVSDYHYETMMTLIPANRAPTNPGGRKKGHPFSHPDFWVSCFIAVLLFLVTNIGTGK